MKFSITDFFSKCDQIRSFLQIWSNLLKKSVMENFIFCAVSALFQSLSLNHLTLPASIPHEERKLNLIFIFTLFCGALKGFIKALKPFEAP